MKRLWMMWLTWRNKRKAHRLRKEFQEVHQAATLAHAAGNEQAHQVAFQRMRELYVQLRAIDPSCPQWTMTRQERRLAERQRRKRPLTQTIHQSIERNRKETSHAEKRH